MSREEVWEGQVSHIEEKIDHLVRVSENTEAKVSHLYPRILSLENTVFGQQVGQWSTPGLARTVEDNQPIIDSLGRLQKKINALIAAILPLLVGVVLILVDHAIH